MTIHRCFADPSAWIGDEVRLSRVEEHHLFNVLRAGKGDRVEVFDGCGRTAAARIEGGGVLEIMEVSETAAPETSLTLIQALPKGRQMDSIVEKAVEVGVSAIVPLISERVVVRLGRAESEKRLERWQKIVLSAARQSGCDWLPEVRPVCAFNDIPEIIAGFDRVLIGVLDTSTDNVHAVADEMHKGGFRKIALMIGPEGDFSPKEISAATGTGAVPVTFGAKVLRVETAAVYGLSVLAYEFLYR